MAKKTKKAKSENEPLVISQLRVALVDTQHGQFYRLMIVETTDGEITQTAFLHNFFNDPSDILNIVNGMQTALTLPVLQVNTIERRH